MATRSKPNWKLLDTLLPVLEKEGWSHAQMAEDWGISLATLENHLTQETGMPTPSKHDYPALFEEYDQRRARGESARTIKATFESRGVNWGTYKNRRSEWNKAHLGTPPDSGPTEAHPGTLEGYQEVMEDVSQSVPDVPYLSTGAEQSAEQSAHTEPDELFDEPNIEVHRAVHPPVQHLDTGVNTSAENSADETPALSTRPEPVQTAVQKFDTGPVQTLDTGAVQRIDRLEDDVRQLAQMMRSVMDHFNDIPVQSPVQITTLPPYPKGKSVRWNLWILDSIRDELATIAAERDVSPSQLVQELLWKALRQE